LIPTSGFDDWFFNAQFDQRGVRDQEIPKSIRCGCDVDEAEMSELWKLELT